MAAKSSKNLTRLFNRLAAPVYLVGSDAKLIYVNAAFEEWVGHEQADLLGLTLVYSSSVLPPGDTEDSVRQRQEKLAGLCPAPEWLAAQSLDSQEATKVSIHSNDNSQWRQATQIRLLDQQDQLTGLLVICEATACDPPSVTDHDVTSEQAHQLLLELRNGLSRRYRFENLVGTSLAAQHIQQQTQLAISVDSNVLIMGPPGAGKEHLARTIFYASEPNVERSIVTIYGSIADSNSVQKSAESLLVEVNGKPKENSQQASQQNDAVDTLLVLDADRLSIEAQSQLLAVIKLPNFKGQVLATSSRHWMELEKQDGFSEELCQKLTSVVIGLKPLSERAQDVPLLAQVFLERQHDSEEAKAGNTKSRFSQEALNQLTEYYWPGNVDELAQVVQAAVQRAKGFEIGVTDLPPSFKDGLKAQRSPKSEVTQIQLTDYLESVESKLILRAMKQATYNKAQAARLLGISRTKLLRRIDHLNLKEQLPAGTTKQTVDSSVFVELDEGELGKE